MITHDIVICKEQKKIFWNEVERKQFTSVPLKQKRMSIPLGLFAGVETADWLMTRRAWGRWGLQRRGGYYSNEYTFCCFFKYLITKKYLQDSKIRQVLNHRCIKRIIFLTK